jgi:hypothetical protein
MFANNQMLNRFLVNNVAHFVEKENCSFNNSMSKCIVKFRKRILTTFYLMVTCFLNCHL